MEATASAIYLICDWWNDFEPHRRAHSSIGLPLWIEVFRGKLEGRCSSGAISQLAVIWFLWSVREVAVDP